MFHMDKNPKMSGNKPNPSNGSVNRHRHMRSSVAAGGHVHGTPGNFNHKQRDGDREKSFRISRSLCERPSKTQKTLEAPSSSSKLKRNSMRRPKTHLEVQNGNDQRRHPVFNTKMNHSLEPLRANKLLVNVTTAHSIGPLRLLLSTDVTVEDVIKSTLLLYAKEGRRPVLTNDPAFFALHYSQFTMDCLNPADKIEDLGSRKFFLCAKATADENIRLSSRDGETAPYLSSCGREIQKISKAIVSWYNLGFFCYFKIG